MHITTNIIKNNMITVVAFCVVLFFSIFICQKKHGLFWDEIYQYASTNSHVGDSIVDCVENDMQGFVIRQADFIDFISYTDNDDYSLKNVSDSVENSLEGKPPLYHLMTATASYINYGKFSIWSGLYINIFLYMITAFFIYLIILNITQNKFWSSVSVMMYGLNLITINNLVLIRPYTLLSTCTVLLTYVIVKRTYKTSFLYRIIFILSIFLGLYTQFTFVYYAFFLCMFYILYKICIKEKKEAVFLILEGIIGIGLVFVAFPAYIKTMYKASELGLFSSLKIGLHRIPTYLFNTAKELFPLVVFGIIVLISLISVKNHRKRSDNKLPIIVIFVGVSSIIALLLIMIMAPHAEDRYICHIIPEIVMIEAYLGYCLQTELEEKHDKNKCKIKDYICTSLFVLLLMLYVLYIRPIWLYENASGVDELLKMHTNDICIYVCDFENIDKKASQIIEQDILQLKNFEEVFIVSDINSSKLYEYIESQNDRNIILYIENERYENSTILEEIIKNSSMNKWEYLYQYTENSSTFFLSKY